MPLIQADFGLSANGVQWLQTLYVLFYGGLLILGGQLADTLGRKRVFMLASGLFLGTSLGAGLAPTFGWLLAFRGVQGIAAALLMPAAMSIVTNAYTDPAARGRAIGIVSAFAAVGSGSGLSVGGLVAASFGWQWVFFMNVPVILLTLGLGWRYIPPDEAPSQRLPDVTTALLLTATIAALSYLVHEAYVLPGWLLVGFSLGTLGLGGWFWHRNSTHSQPLLDMDLITPIMPIVGVFGCLGASFTGFLFLISLLLQHDEHLSPAMAGLLLFPFSLLSAFTGKVLLPHLLRRLASWQVAGLGMACLTLSAVFLALHVWLAPTHLTLLLLAMACANGLGIALAFSGLTVLSLAGIPEAKHGLVSGVGTTAYFFGGGLGLSILSLTLSDAGRTIGLWPLLWLGTFGLLGAAGLAALMANTTKSKRLSV